MQRCPGRSPQRITIPKDITYSYSWFFCRYQKLVLQLFKKRVKPQSLEFQPIIRRGLKNLTPLAPNPMLLSGLALTGVSSYFKNPEQYTEEIEDGLLTAYEATTLNLDSTELVVLSACVSGRGKVSQGEGVYGLQRGFQVAGAKSILMSLWNVEDEATQELMTLFYKNWLTKKQSKREAFRQAQLDLKAKYPNEPFKWGAFVMVGE